MSATTVTVEVDVCRRRPPTPENTETHTVILAIDPALDGSDLGQMEREAELVAANWASVGFVMPLATRVIDMVL